ncbi:MAG: hypothetical protein K2G88_01550 [Oscillospiraceae bacterium]|nr:hypothetical protein [Oscillospiraceae bacterium]
MKIFIKIYFLYIFFMQESKYIAKQAVRDKNMITSNKKAFMKFLKKFCLF